MKVNVGYISLLLITNSIVYVRCQGPVVTVKAVLNGTASLPCNIIPPTSSDSVILVVWYRNELKPIYSFDSRDGFANATHWKDENRLGDRGHFGIDQSPASLVISNVQEQDEGSYRCRVDFMKSPTRNSKVFLSVIVPPEKPIIKGKDGKIVENTAGPFTEGSSIEFICSVRGGKPLPALKWLADGKVLDSKDVPITETDVIASEVVLRNVNRNHLNSTLVCQASNTEIHYPISTTVYLDVYYKPFNVTIVERNVPLSANAEYEIECKAVHSRPHATITWWIDGKALTNYAEKVVVNETISILKFVPNSSDHGKTLVCRAENPKIAGSAMEAVSVVNVAFVPVLKLDFGARLNPKDIEEGDDIYFECKIMAHPPAYKVEWIHNGISIQHNVKNGVIINHNTLVFQKISRNLAGSYMCLASNVEGDGKSNVVQLDVMYKPVCKPNQKYVYGVAKEENAQVICEVDAFPPPDDFKWLFNHTTKPIPEARYSSVDNRKGISILTFSPQTELDYGILMCYARNAVGRQTEPCVFHIIPAGLPEPPYNCTVSNRTSDSIDVVCKEGFDNGQSQHFVAEVIDQSTDAVIANMTSSKVAFKIGRLSSGRSLKMNVYAVNTRGRSEAVVLETFTLESAQKHTAGPSTLKVIPLIGALLGFTAISVVLSIAAICILRCRRRSRRIKSRLAEPNDAILHKTKCISEMNGYEIEKTPDVVQCNNKAVEYRNARIDDKNGLAGNMTRIQDNCDVDGCSTKPASLEDILSNCGVNVKDASVSQSNRDFKYQNSSISPTSTDSGAFVTNKIYPTFLDGRSLSRNLAADCAVTSIAPHHREVITVRTPLPHSDQESCV